MARQKKDEALRISYEKLNELVTAERNPKKHDGESISKSIKRFGFNDPMQINERTKKLIAGHGRLEQLLAMQESGAQPPKHVRVDDDGEWLVPVLRGVSFKNKKEVEAYIIAHNQTTIAGGWEHDSLAEILGELSESESALDGLGFSGSEIETYLLLAQGPDENGEAPPDLSQLSEGAEGSVRSAGENVKSVHLVMTLEEHQAFVRHIKKLSKRFKATTTTETVLRALQHVVSGK